MTGRSRRRCGKREREFWVEERVGGGILGLRVVRFRGMAGRREISGWRTWGVRGGVG